MMTTNNEKNLHKEYWGSLFNTFISFCKKNRKLLSYFVVLVLLLIVVYFGFLKYSPEFSFPFGTFSVDKETINQNSENSNSKILDRSIFDLVEKVRSDKMTSQERVSSIGKIEGLQTQIEQGVVEDVGTGGLILLIRGNSTDGSFGIIRCDFSRDWKARLSLLKKDAEIKFTGTISYYDLPQSWIVLKNCSLVNDETK